MPESEIIKPANYNEYSEQDPCFPWWVTDQTIKDWQFLTKGMFDSSKATPDVPLLNMRKWHPIFVYGTLKRNKSAHSMLGDKPFFVGDGHTKAESFVLYKTASGAFPILLLGDTSATRPKDAPEPKAVQGEVYMVDVPTIKRLDQYEDNGTLYKRIRIAVKLGGNHKGKEMYTWGYLGLRSAWDSDVKTKSIKPCPYFTTKTEAPFSYYTFIQPRN